MDGSTELKVDKLEAYAIELLKAAILAADTMRYANTEGQLTQNRNLTDSRWQSLFFEFTYFYLHLTDRAVFGRISDEIRRELITELSLKCISYSVAEIYESETENRKTQRIKEYAEACRTVMQNLAGHKNVVGENGESLKGTLVWEFGKHIAELMGHESETVYLQLCDQIVTKAVNRLNPWRFVERMDA